MADATKIPWRFRDSSAFKTAGIFGIFAQNLPLWSLRPSLTVGMTKIPKILGLFHYFFAGIFGISPQNPAPSSLHPPLLVFWFLGLGRKMGQEDPRTGTTQDPRTRAENKTHNDQWRQNVWAPAVGPLAGGVSDPIHPLRRMLAAAGRGWRDGASLFPAVLLVTGVTSQERNGVRLCLAFRLKVSKK